MNGHTEQEELEAYLSAGFGRAVRVRDLAPLGGEAGDKGFGYGAPIRVKLEGAPVDEVAVHTVGVGNPEAGSPIPARVGEPFRYHGQVILIAG